MSGAPRWHARARHRHLRLRRRRPHRRAPHDRGAAERAPHLPRRHRALSVRHQVRRGRVALHARERPVPARQGREAAGRRVQHHVGGRARRAPRPHRRARSSASSSRAPAPRSPRRATARSASSAPRARSRAAATPARSARSTPGLEIYTRACPLFVALAEEGWVENAIAEQAAAMYLASLRQSRIDTLVLGCTHYPLLARTIGAYLGPEVQLVDSATETAREVARVLAERGLAARRRPGLDVVLRDRRARSLHQDRQPLPRQRRRLGGAGRVARASGGALGPAVRCRRRDGAESGGHGTSSSRCLPPASARR